jgi:hypothetical protein
MTATASETARSGRRSPLRGFAFGCLGVGTVLFLGLLGYLGWANLLPPPEPDNRVYPNPNGYDAVQAALLKLASEDPGPEVADWRYAHLARLRAAVLRDETALEELRKALRHEYLSPPFALHTVRSVTSAQWGTGRRLAARSRVALADGQPGAAIGYALDAIQLGSKTMRGGVATQRLTAHGVTSIAVAAAEPCVSQLDASEARAAGGRLEGILRDIPPFSEMVREEARFALGSARDILTGRGGSLVPEGPGVAPAAWASLKDGTVRFLYPKSWAYRNLDAYYRRLVEEAAKPYPHRAWPSPPRDVLGQQAATDVATIGIFDANYLAKLRLLRLQVALQEFKVSRGAYPARLTELPGVSREALVDPFTEQPPVYRRKGRGYVLYSLGPNRKDDGGLVNPTGLFQNGAAADLVAGSLAPPRRGR